MPTRSQFDPSKLSRKVLTLPLLEQFAEHADNPDWLYKVIIDLNLEYQGGRQKAAVRVQELFEKVTGGAPADQAASGEGLNRFKNELNDQYVFGQFRAGTLRGMVRADAEPVTAAEIALPTVVPPRSPVQRTQSAIHLIWPDFPVRARLIKTVSTVKANAARLSFAATGTGIIWAILDTGIQGDHVHFTKHENLNVPDPLRHRDFTVDATTLDQPSPDEKPLEDQNGHGTHVAGIVAGEMQATPNSPVRAVLCEQVEGGDPSYRRLEGIDTISGMAPQCKLLSLRVLDPDGDGYTSNLLAALGYVQQLNANGRHLVVHGVNISAGYEFKPEWFACGQSPICVEVDRLVRSGVVVVVAAGNTGSTHQAVFVNTQETPRWHWAGQGMSINDPGNAALAITVGSTHRDMPHTYGISYFSSKGPTGDGRLKPDLVAPGEKILSCAAGDLKAKCQNGINDGQPCDYAEDSGTSMATPHVSGIIAAFLSIRQEYLGNPEEVKRIFMATATDLGRDRYFQGSGLIDLMRAIQSV